MVLEEKNTYSINSELLFNLQILCFTNIDNIESFYNKIKKKFNENKYKMFFNYYSKKLLGKTIPKKLWNFSDILENENNLNNFSFTNNVSENINRYLNQSLKRVRCSSILFRRNVLDIILQFNNKIHYDNKTQKHKSEILKFYVKKNKCNLNALNKIEIKKLTSEYENFECLNINKQNC